MIEIEKGNFDWKRVIPFIDLEGAAELDREAKQQEKDDPDAAREKNAAAEQAHRRKEGEKAGRNEDAGPARPCV